MITYSPQLISFPDVANKIPKRFEVEAVKRIAAYGIRPDARSAAKSEVARGGVSSFCSAV
jgi:hypothetical protein